MMDLTSSSLSHLCSLYSEVRKAHSCGHHSLSLPPSKSTSLQDLGSNSNMAPGFASVYFYLRGNEKREMRDELLPPVFAIDYGTRNKYQPLPLLHYAFSPSSTLLWLTKTLAGFGGFPGGVTPNLHPQGPIMITVSGQGACSCPLTFAT